MKKRATIRFDIEKLNAEFVPNRTGADGEDPGVRNRKRLQSVFPERAQLFFERLHKRHSKKGETWVTRVLHTPKSEAPGDV